MHAGSAKSRPLPLFVKTIHWIVFTHALSLDARSLS